VDHWGIHRRWVEHDSGGYWDYFDILWLGEDLGTQPNLHVLLCDIGLWPVFNGIEPSRRKPLIMKQLTVSERVWGALLGGAIGDALGAPTECMDYRDIRRFLGDYRTFGELERAFAALAGRPVTGNVARVKAPPFHPIGHVTDDTAMADLLLDAIFETGGDLTAYGWAKAWERFDQPLTLADGSTFNRLDHVHWIERIPFCRNKLREIPKRELGHGEANATNVIMFIAPVGLLCAGDPLLAELMAVDVGAVNQHGKPRDVGAAYAAVLAATFLPGITVERLVGIGVERTRHSRSVKELEAMIAIARQCRTCDEFTERYYAEILGKLMPYRDEEHELRESCVSWNSTEVLGPVLAALLITQGEDTATMMLACAKFGRDADTICRVAGGLAGALNGADSIPSEWRETVLQRNAWLRERLPSQAEQLAKIAARRLEGGRIP
jgi:ADP-ribosylglycohydrolase